MATAVVGVSGVSPGYQVVSALAESSIDGPNNRSAGTASVALQKTGSGSAYRLNNDSHMWGVNTDAWGHYDFTATGWVTSSGTTAWSGYVGHNPDGTGSLGGGFGFQGGGTPGLTSGSGTDSLALTPIAPAAPSTPVLSNIGPNQVTATWTRGAGYSDPSSYTLQWSTDNFATIAGSLNVGTALTGTATGLTPGTTYQFREVAANPSGSATSAVASAQTVGAVHINVAGTWKTFLRYQNVAGAWKTTVPYINDATGTPRACG